MLLDEFSTIFDRPEKIKKLREYILSLAVRGKLVEQDENDEPASLLLDKIKEENEELKLKGRYNKQRKTKDTVDAEATYGHLPSNWKWCLLDDVVPYITDYQANGSFSALKSNVKTYNEEEYAILVRLKDLRLNIENNDLIYTDKSGYEFLSKSHLYGGEILIANVGAGVGISMIMPNINKKATIAPNMFIIELSKYIDKNYFLYFVKTKLYKDEILNKASATGQPKMNKNEFRSLTFSLPPLNEQKRIVEKVDYLMEFCDKLEAQLEKKVKYGSLSAKSVLNSVSNCSSHEELEEALRFIIENFKDLTLADGAVGELKNAILSLAVKGKLVPQDDSDESASVLLERIREEKDRLVKEKKIKKEKPLPEISEDKVTYALPKGWEWVRLGDYTQINPRNSVDDDLETSFVPMKLIDDSFSNSHTSEIKKWSEIKKGFTHFAERDVVVAKITPCFENRKSAVMNKLMNGIGAGTTELYVVRSFDELILPEYILNVFKTHEFIKGGVDTYTGTAGQQRVKKDYISNLVVGIPPLNEQKRIVEKVDNLMKVCDELELRIEKSKKYSEKLMESILKDSFKA